MNDYSMYHYYNGEEENPYIKILDGTEIDNNAPNPPASMITEWKKVLNPVDKKGMFTLWNKQSLTQIADKRETNLEKVFNLYTVKTYGA